MAGKLQKSDKEYLLSIGYLDRDLPQIEEAVGKTIYETEEGKRVSHKEARRILGTERFLSGIGRSAFHFSSVRDGMDGTKIYFDSSRLYKF